MACRTAGPRAAGTQRRADTTSIGLLQTDALGLRRSNAAEGCGRGAWARCRRARLVPGDGPIGGSGLDGDALPFGVPKRRQRSAPRAVGVDVQRAADPAWRFDGMV